MASGQEHTYNKTECIPLVLTMKFILLEAQVCDFCWESLMLPFCICLQKYAHFHENMSYFIFYVQIKTIQNANDTMTDNMIYRDYSAQRSQAPLLSLIR